MQAQLERQEQLLQLSQSKEQRYTRELSSLNQVLVARCCPAACLPSLAVGARWWSKAMTHHVSCMMSWQHVGESSRTSSPRPPTWFLSSK